MTATCQGCGAPLPPSKPCGRPRKWCGERCRKAQYAGTCVDCGAPTSGSNGSAKAPEHCEACTPSLTAARAAWAAIRNVHYRNVQALWHEGFTLREIAATLNTTPGNIGVTVYRMRRGGWDVPYRHRRPDLASPAERHGTRADGTPSPSLDGGLSSPAGVAVQPLAASRERSADG